MKLQLSDLIKYGVVTDASLTHSADHSSPWDRNIVIGMREFCFSPAALRGARLIPGQAPHSLDEYAENILLGYGQRMLPSSIVPAFWTQVAEYIIYGRWPAGEAQILRQNSIVECYEYAVRAVKDRWPEMEDLVIAALRHWRSRERPIWITPEEELKLILRYRDMFMAGRWPEVETLLIVNAL